MSSPNLPSNSYSTIFQCDENAFICILRVFQGVISVTMFILFLKGYRVITTEQNNPLSKQDKRIFMLAMWQTLLLSVYYFVFQEFVILATIRNFLIWIGINIFHVLCKIYWLKDEQTLQKIKYGINALKIGNIIMWFIISLGNGSSVINTDFNLGYNCRLIDWMILSGVLLAVVTAQSYIGVNIYDKLKWEFEHTNQNNKRDLQSISTQSNNIVILLSASFSASLVMFIWDFFAYSFSTSDDNCSQIFSGNTFFRQILCFFFKLITMQLTPCAIYYVIYHQKRLQFYDNYKETTNQKDLAINFLDDDASDFNRTLASRVDSRASLFSDHGSRPNQASQYL